MLNHSCAPNCVLAFDGAHLEIRTIKPVEKSEELTHSYVDLCQPTVTRQKVLKGRYGFDCVCERCEGGGGVPMSTEDLINTNPVHDLDALLTCEVADASSHRGVSCSSTAPSSSLSRANCSMRRAKRRATLIRSWRCSARR